jgi:hypothetical protein
VFVIRKSQGSPVARSSMPVIPHELMSSKSSMASPRSLKYKIRFDTTVMSMRVHISSVVIVDEVRKSRFVTFMSSRIPPIHK